MSDFNEPHLDAEDSPEYKRYEAEQLLGDLLARHPELNFVSLGVLMEIYLKGYSHAQKVVNESFKQSSEVPF